jgi:hypothetical protein
MVGKVVQEVVDSRVLSCLSFTVVSEFPFIRVYSRDWLSGGRKFSSRVGRSQLARRNSILLYGTVLLADVASHSIYCPIREMKNGRNF